MKPWRIISESEVGAFSIFTLRRRVMENPRNGHQHPFFVVHVADWVNVVALTESDEVVLVRQVRAGTGQPHLEVPGGLVDPGEAPADAALRELLEETGYTGDRAERIGMVHPNPALMGNCCYTYLVRGARRVASQDLDPAEDIEVFTRPRTDLPAMVASGEITHAVVVAAIAHLQWADRPDGK